MSKTVFEMAQSVGAVDQDLLDRHTEYVVFTKSQLEAFANLVRADEREACANLVFHSPPSDEYESPLAAVYKAIRNRSNT